ncbi:MAG: hypothetical protein Q9208_000633 [Pyrenodesmia sp. 3 TL-2023]
MDLNTQVVDVVPESQNEESDWEYEYDETETEIVSANSVQSFYVTLDVSSASHQTRVPKKAAAPLSREVVPAPEDQQQNGNIHEETSPIDPALQDPTAPPNGHNGPLPAPADPPDPQERIQILDLHTHNPLISYNNRIYTCTWGSTLGTDIFLASPSSISAITSQTTIRPLLNLSELSVLGTSCINLTARAATIVPKADNPQPQQTPPAPVSELPPVTHPTFAPTATNGNDLTIPTNPLPKPAPLKIPLNDSAPNSRRKQASFLESLMAIKTAKGETDQVTVHTKKSFQGAGWRSQRKVVEAASEATEQSDVIAAHNNEDEDTAMNDAVDASAGTTEQRGDDESGGPSPAKRARTTRRRGPSGRPIGRPRGGRARGRWRMGVLLGDHVPEAGEESEIGGELQGGGGTPVRWAEVELARSREIEGRGDVTEQAKGDANEIAGLREGAEGTRNEGMDDEEEEREGDVVTGHT